MSLILPFLNALGYDIYDPMEVMAEYIADFAVKKVGQFEKVDYAIAINGNIVMLVEAKARRQKAEAHDGQLSRYFNGVLTTKVAIVSNGIEYRFFTDLRDKNVMDKEPFFTFNIFAYSPKDIENLKLFHRDNFDIAAISRQAEEMVYVKAMTQLIGNFLRSPSDDFIRFLVAELGKVAPGYEIQGRITSKIVDKFKPIVKKSIQDSLVELMTRSLSQEIDIPLEDSKESSLETGGEVEAERFAEDVFENEIEELKIVTTEEELEAFAKIKTIVSGSIHYRFEIKYKDTISYFGIHLGKVTWWIFRLYLSHKKKSIVIRLPLEVVRGLAPDFEIYEVPVSAGDAASKIIINSVEDIARLTPVILKCYETEAVKH